MKRKLYDLDTKARATAEAVAGQKPLAKIAKEHGVKLTTLKAWARDFRASGFHAVDVPPQTSDSQVDSLRRSVAILEKRVENLMVENSKLKRFIISGILEAMELSNG